MTCELAYKLCTSVLFRSAGGVQNQLQFLDSQVKPHHLHGQTTEENGPGNSAAILLADIRAAGVAIKQSPVTIALLVPLVLLSYLIFYPPYKGMEKSKSTSENSRMGKREREKSELLNQNAWEISKCFPSSFTTG